MVLLISTHAHSIWQVELDSFIIFCSMGLTYLPTFIYHKFTLPETNSLPLKMDGWKTSFVSFWGNFGLFSGANLLLVFLREGNPLYTPWKLT